MEKSLVELFEANELRVSELYRIYAQKLPTHKDFWEELSREEIGHANEIANSYADKSEEHFTENKFTRGVVKYVSDFVDEKITEAKEKKLTHSEAINIALRVEQSILEKKCFEMFTPTNVSIKNIMEKLNRDTEKHVGMLRKELKKQDPS